MSYMSLTVFYADLSPWIEGSLWGIAVFPVQDIHTNLFGVYSC